MQQNPVHPEKLSFFGLLPTELDAALIEKGWPSFRAKQLRDWVYVKLVTDPERMTNLSKLDRQKLGEWFEFASAQVVRKQDSSDGTQKLLLGWPGGNVAETVMIPDGTRRTACVSSQVGCPVGCTFCASGVGGVKGNLSAAQIVEQVYRLDEMLSGDTGILPVPSRSHGQDAHVTGKPISGQRIGNIVFMGMGEPMANYANVVKAIRILHDPSCFNIGARKITISTVGVPAKMRELAEEELPLNLAISLHAPNEALRKKLIPWAEHFALDEILSAARYYFEKTGREITLEYILLHGVNDRPEHARQLVKVCKSIRANVNLIRYNEVAGLPYERPKSGDVVAFQEILREGGVNAHVRKSRGRDIDAACGQLRRKEQEQGQSDVAAVTIKGA
jgi:23S rRNA (adenine2503-C2)-methyltransferase